MICLVVDTRLTTGGSLGDGFDPANGWTIWTSGAGFIQEGAQSTEGDIFHITALQGASFTLGFYGECLNVLNCFI